MFNEYHKYLGYLLAPIRLLTVFVSLAMSVPILTVLLPISDYCANRYIVFINDVIVNACGIDVYIEGRENISKDNKIIVSNHICAYDISIVFKVFDQMLGYVANEKYNIFPVSMLMKQMKCILCSRERKNNTVAKIKEGIKETSLVIFADSCNVIPPGETIAPFKSGAFIAKEPIQPMVIRYIPSSNNQLNFTKGNLQNHLYNLFTDGHYQVYVKVLPLVKFDEDEHKTFEGYRDKIHGLMSKELKTLPKQYPPRIMVKPPNVFYNYLLYILFTFGMLSFLVGNWKTSSICNMLFITNYFSVNYNTSNTRLFSNLILVLSIFYVFL